MAAVTESLNFRIYLEICVRLRTLSLPCIRAFFFDRFPRGSHEPASDGGSPVRLSRGLEKPTSAATTDVRDICWEKETRTFNFLRSWNFVLDVLFLREELLV